MTFQEFDKLMDSTYERLKELRKTKGREYALSDEDRLANFKEIAKELGVTPEQVLITYSEKHGRAIKSYCKNGREFSEESITSRILDRIMYDFLLLGLIQDSNFLKGERLNEKERSKIPLSG